MNCNKEIIKNEEQIIKNRLKKQSNREYYKNVRKYVQKIQRCQLFGIDFKCQQDMNKIIIEEGPFYVAL